MKRFAALLLLLLPGSAGFQPAPADPGHVNFKNPSGKWIDQFGQNNTKNWPEKIKTIAQLKHFDQDECADLSSHHVPADRDEYQAWRTGPQLNGSGFFRLEKYKDRWWFVAPNGHLFYSAGIDCVGAGAHTRINEKTNASCIWLPDRNSEFRAAFKDEAFSFYICNLIRKWGAGWKPKFVDRAVQRSKSWGFTCIANWSDDEFNKVRLPYCSTGPACWELKNLDYIDGDIADAFDPHFEKEVLRVASSLAKNKNDKYLLGYFVDNEMPWWNIPYDVLLLKSSSPCKIYWLDQLRAKYGSIENLNKSWGIRAANFDDVRWPGDKAPKAAQDDMTKFRGEFAERFYDCWYRGIKAADPNHLVLGSRIPYPMDDVALACAKHTDVLSFNHYDYYLSKEFDRYYKLTDKAILIGEFDFDSVDAGLLSAFVPVKNQKQRGAGYSFYAESAAAKPYIVGTHYFQYIDEPLTGRGDGETSFNGFVNVADVPYKHLVNAARETNLKIYEIHAGSRPATVKQPLAY